MEVVRKQVRNADFRSWGNDDIWSSA